MAILGLEASSPHSQPEALSSCPCCQLSHFAFIGLRTMPPVSGERTEEEGVFSWPIYVWQEILGLL